MGYHRALQEAGLGVDDMPLSSYFGPPLTTMRQELRQVVHGRIVDAMRD